MIFGRRRRREQRRAEDTLCAVRAQADAENVIRHVESQDAEVDATVDRLVSRVPRNHFVVSMKRAMGDLNGGNT